MLSYSACMRSEFCARGDVLVIAALVGLHYFAYHVEIAQKLAEALGAEQQREIGVVAVFLHRAHMAAVGGELVALGLGGQLDLLGLLLHEGGVEVNLLLWISSISWR